MSELIGVLGALLFPAVWMLQRYRLYESVDLLEVNARYVFLYLLGSIVLTYHAFVIRDLSFILFSVMMTLFTATEYFLLLMMQREHG